MFDSLVQAIDSDLEWKRIHTRLLVRAKEWERKGRDSSFLLRGKDLLEAEQWLSHSFGVERETSNLQRDYVIASRRASNKRQGITVGAIACAAVIAVVL